MVAHINCGLTIRLSENRIMDALETLNEDLKETEKLLIKTAFEIINLRFHPHHNLRKIAEAIANISNIRAQIYERRPDLAPEAAARFGSGLHKGY